ncbi:MAG TPA: alpha/beta fold hydrolase BchO [Acetobacteraceae bacterium]|nr:alpha/beta fold hydrolase BchO [Acetobacteraceae bacterium]
MTDRPVWERDGRDWPNREASRFVRAAGLRWHVQVMGQGPALLLAHGTAATTHSWRALAPLLATRFTVVAPDLPGHGFTEAPPAVSLTVPGMACALAELLDTLGLRPALAAGHSAGAAVLLRMCLDGRMAPRAVVSLNGALMPFGRSQSDFFSRMARLLAGLPFIPSLFAWRAQNRAVAERLLRDTGSSIDARGVELYARMFRHAGHLRSALHMMANWDLHPLLRDLPRLGPALILIVGTADRAVPPSDSERLRQILPAARILRLPGLGHLAHEERPQQVAELILGLSEAAA